MSPWTLSFYLQVTLLVELTLPSTGVASPVGSSAIVGPSTTTWPPINEPFSKCPDVPSDSFQWPKPRQLADRSQRNRMQKMVAENNYTQTWDPKDPISNLRWRPVIDLLPDSVRTAILNLTRANQITSTDLRLLDTNSIAMLQKELVQLLTEDQVVDIIRSLLQKQQYRQAAQVIERMSNRLTNNPDVMVTLWNDQQMSVYQRCTKEVQAFLRQALEILPSPSKWNSTLVRKYGFGLISAMPPDFLIRIRDAESATMVLDRWLSDDTFGCGFPTGSDATDSVISKPRVQVELMVAALGDDMKQWSSSSLSRYSTLLLRLSPRSLALISEQNLTESLTFLSQIKDWKDGQGFVLVQQLLANNLTSLVNATGDRLTNVLDRLNYLGPYLLPEAFNVSSQKQILLAIWANKMDSFSQRGMTLPRPTASALLQYRLANLKDQMDTMSLANLSLQLDANYLKVAPWRVWKLNLNQSESSSVINKGFLQRLAIDRSSGSLTDGQALRLSMIATRVIRAKEGHWDMANTPAIYWSGANLSEYSSLPVKNIQEVMGQVTRVADKLNGGQLAIIYTKLRDGKVDLLESNATPLQVIKAMLPVPYLRSQYSTDQLQSLAADMPADAIIRLLYASTKLKGNISIDDLNRQPLLATHVSPAQINAIPLSDTPALLTALSTSTQGPNIQAVRELQTRLRNFTRAKRVDVANNDISLLENVWLSNLDIYPATILADFSVEALQMVGSMRKIELLRALGRLSLIDYYTIPKYKRTFILQQGLAAMKKNGSSVINEEDLAIIGNAIVDLTGTGIIRLSARAFENVLPILQGDVDIFGGLSARPCLTSEQRAGVRRTLKTIYGYPSTWNIGTVMVTCCSLDTLTATELEAIRDDFILDGCQGCNADIHPPIHLQVLSQTFKAACLFELGFTEMQNELYSGKALLAKRRAAAALKIYRDGKVIVRGLNQTSAVYNSTVNATSNSINLTCEAVIASGSGSGFTVSQLKALSLDDIRDCLYELGYTPLDSDQATTIWNRVLAVYGSANNIPKDQLVLLGWILAGVDTTSLNQLQLNDSDVVASLGTVDRLISLEKLQILANRVLVSGWKQGPNYYSGQDLITLGRLLCGMNTTTIQRISTTSYLEASAYLGMMLFQPRCSTDVLTALAAKSVDTAVFGPPSNWNAAIVRNVGAVIGGLSPEQLRLIPPDSLRGLTPGAVVSISANNFQAFKTQQIRNFPLAVAQSVTVDQRSGLVTEMANALDYVIYGDTRGGSSKCCPGSSKLIAVTVGLTLFLRLPFLL